MTEKNTNKPTKSEVALAEERVLAGWKENKIFEKTLEKTKNGKPFVFYDGPPFATGEPHYGHVLSGTIKDVIPRYQTMKGRYVRRQWGWDCHGLPIENIIEQELKLGHKKDIEDYGVGNFNEAARRAVLRYDSHWKEIIPRLGRFIDMDLSYKTMDASYSESIWWAFKTLYDKKLAYEGYKIMYVCPRCETAVSNFEVAQGYRDLTDISVTVKFELSDDPGVYLLAWTTTPWTLPGNTALAVNKDIEYVKVESVYENKKNYFIVAKERVEEVFKASTNYKIINEFKGSELIGKSYKPLFDYYANDAELKNRERGWKIYGADFVTTESGTGIVHIAPAFGEDDMNLCNEFKLPFIQNVGMDGRFKPEVKDFAGMYVKQKGDTMSADVEVLKFLAAKGSLFSKEKIVHSYPLCWRCETPLLNYATPSWFVKVTEIRDEIVAENNKVGWVPAHVGEGRFGKWLLGARDWAISRSRYWGSPLPVWKCAECEKIEVIGGLDELKGKASKSGNKYFLMRHGEAKGNKVGFLDSGGDPANHLTEDGAAQAEAGTKELKNFGITKIYASPLLRTKQTAEIAAEAIGLGKDSIIFDGRLRELNFGEFDGKSALDEFLAYRSGHGYNEPFPEGESYLDAKRRFGAFLYETEKMLKGERVLVVTHGIGFESFSALVKGAGEEESKKIVDEIISEIKPAEVREFDFVPLPHNGDYELDFHRPYIDDVIFDCECGGTMRRVSDVFDCWFESGSMPYAQFHYPFENEDEFKRNFPADFIAEGMDQTRGWFYSLLVLSTALFGHTPFKNVIVNGIILAEDGQKMSKRLKNYPEVAEVVDKFGADALRYYLLSSPIMRAEDLAFSEKGIDEVYKKNIVRLNNVYAFYELYRSGEEPMKKGEAISGQANANSENVLDKWIIARLNQLIRGATEGLDSYELDRAARPIGDFIDDLSTWYIRRSRDRFKSDDENDKKNALETTNYVLTELSKVLAPFMPFIADDLYLKVTGGKKEESVHLESWPVIDRQLTTDDEQLIQEMQKTRDIVSSGLEARAKANIKVRQPLQSLKLKTENLKLEFAELIKDEVNVKEIIFGERIENEVELDMNITPELKEEGDVRDLIRAIQDFRKTEGLTPSDRVALLAHADEGTKALIERNSGQIKKTALLSDITVSESDEELSFQILNPKS